VTTITGDGPKITATGDGSQVTVTVTTGGGDVTLPIDISDVTGLQAELDAIEGGDSDLIIIFQHFTNLNIANPHPFGAFLPEGALVELVGQTTDSENGTYVAPASAGTNPLVLADDQILDVSNAGRQVTVLRVLQGSYVYGPLEWIVATDSSNNYVFSPQSGITLFAQRQFDANNGAVGAVDFDGALNAGALVLVYGAANGDDDGLWRFVADESPMVRARVEAGVGTTVRVMVDDTEWVRTPHSGWVEQDTDLATFSYVDTEVAAVDATLDVQRQQFADELAADIVNVFRCNGLGTGRWSTPNLTDEFTTGISVRTLMIPRRPATYPKFAETLTQPHDTGAGLWDNFEQAVVWPDDTFNGNDDSVSPARDLLEGRPELFWEQTEDGGTEDGSGLFIDCLLASDQAVEVMTDITFGTGVGRHWLRVPYELDDGGTYHVDADDDAIFRLMGSKTSAKFEDLDAHTEEWWLGNNFTGDIARIIVRDGIDGDLIANPDANSETVGASSFADGAGNTWTAGAAAEVVELNPTGGTVDVVSNVAQDRILGRTSSGSGDSE
jgi:hypothetical protein